MQWLNDRYNIASSYVAHRTILDAESILILFAFIRPVSSVCPVINPHSVLCIHGKTLLLGETNLTLGLI